MAHFAGIDGNFIVQAVNRVSDTDAPTEADGVAFCRSLWGDTLTWLQTSYNGSIRKNYAGIGYTYDAGRDAFISPQRFSSWTLDETTCRWVPPIPYPADDPGCNHHRWNEETQSWQQL